MPAHIRFATSVLKIIREKTLLAVLYELLDPSDSEDLDVELLPVACLAGIAGSIFRQLGVPHCKVPQQLRCLSHVALDTLHQKACSVLQHRVESPK